MSMRHAMLESSDFDLVSGVELRVRKRVSGFAPGEQRSPVSGGGIEFADYREYRPGDDARLLDWSVYLRSRKLLVKVCAEEKELTLIVLLDASRSMSGGKPEKMHYAKRVACVLAGAALRAGNRAGLCAMGQGLVEALRPERSRVTLPDFVRAAAALGAQDRFSPLAAMHGFAARYGRKCVAVLISDLLFPDWRKTIGLFASSGCEAHVVQLLSPEEYDPPFYGESTLVDSEDGSEAAMHVDARALRGYRAELDRFLAETGSACAGLGMSRTLARTDEPLRAFFKDRLRKSGLVC